jgi:hypothetical protein
VALPVSASAMTVSNSAHRAANPRLAELGVSVEEILAVITKASGRALSPACSYKAVTSSGLLPLGNSSLPHPDAVAVEENVAGGILLLIRSKDGRKASLFRILVEDGGDGIRSVTAVNAQNVSSTAARLASFKVDDQILLATTHIVRDGYRYLKLTPASLL